MASVCKDKNGRKRILFVAGDGVRRTIRLGKCDAKQADAVRAKVENLQAAALSGSTDPATAQWVKTMDIRLYDRFSKVGLVPPRERIRPTLERLLTAYFETLDVKAGTLTTYRQTGTALEAYFKPTTLLSTITKLTADHWRQSMNEAGLAEATVAKRIKTARAIFKQAVRWQMVGENPFAEVRAGSQANRSRMHFVTLEATHTHPI